MGQRRGARHRRGAGDRWLVARARELEQRLSHQRSDRRGRGDRGTPACPRVTGRPPGPLDPVAALLSIAGLVSLVYGIIEAPTRGWTSPETVAWIGLGCAILAGFVGWELRSRAPMLDVRLFMRPRFGAASLAMTLSSFALMGTLFFVTQYLQFVLGYRPVDAGLALLPVAAGVLIGAITSSRLVPRIGSKLPVAAGLAVMAVGLAWASTAQVDSPYLLIGSIAAVIGLGGGLAMTPATDSIMGSLPKSRAGVGSAMNDTTRQIGGALGVAILGSVLSSGYQNSISGPLQAAPPAVAAVARSSIGAATVIAGQIGGSNGQALLSAARSAFVQGMATTAQVGAVFLLGAAALALALLPARAPAPDLPPRADPPGAHRAAEGSEA